MRITLFYAVAAGLVAAVLTHSWQQENNLLRADPNVLPDNPVAMAFALDRGAALFEQHCAACHDTGGGGNAELGSPDLRDGDWLYGAGSVSDIEQIITYGIRSHHPKAWNMAIMPAYATERPSADRRIPSLSPRDIPDLVEFLFREQRRPADGPAAARGANLFRGAAGCYDCHAMDGRGDAAIGAPNLTDAITLYGDGSRAALSFSISYGRHGICPAWAAQVTPAGIRELALFVHSLSHPRKQARAAPSVRG